MGSTQLFINSNIFYSIDCCFWYNKNHSACIFKVILGKHRKKKLFVGRRSLFTKSFIIEYRERLSKLSTLTSVDHRYVGGLLMNDQSNRIICPHCKTNNFQSSTVCWQCGKPLSPAKQPDQQPPPPVQPPPPYQQQPGQPPPPYQQPVQPQPPHQRPLSEPPSSGDGRIFVTLGFIFAGLGFCCCYLFSVASIVMGFIAYNKKDKLAVWVIVAGASSLLISIIIGIAAKSLLPGFMEQFMPKGMFPQMDPGQSPF